jgi:hypothetical protein
MFSKTSMIKVHTISDIQLNDKGDTALGSAWTLGREQVPRPQHERCEIWWDAEYLTMAVERPPHPWSLAANEEDDTPLEWAWRLGSSVKSQLAQHVAFEGIAYHISTMGKCGR